MLGAGPEDSGAGAGLELLPPPPVDRGAGAAAADDDEDEDDGRCRRGGGPGRALGGGALCGRSGGGCGTTGLFLTNQRGQLALYPLVHAALGRGGPLGVGSCGSHVVGDALGFGLGLLESLRLVLGLALHTAEAVDQVPAVPVGDLDVGLLRRRSIPVGREQRVQLGAVVAALVGLDGEGAHLATTLVELGVGLVDTGLGLGDLLLGLGELEARRLVAGVDVHQLAVEAGQLGGHGGRFGALGLDRLGPGRQGGREGNGQEAGDDDCGQHASTATEYPGGLFRSHCCGIFTEERQHRNVIDRIRP